ncbi:MAG: formylglycine-generating enzyme family protein [Limisphaerales bacterium]
MKPFLLAAFAATGVLTLLSGCDRKASNSGGNPPTPVPDRTAADSNRKVAVSSTTGTNSPVGMVQLPGGRFMMGDKDEVDAKAHEVEVSPFSMDQHLVTQEQYQKVMGANPSRWKGDRNPVEQVRWSDAVKFCNQRSQLEGLQPCYDLHTWSCNFEANGYRLPTEAEWEYACRAGTTTAYFFGDTPAKLGDYAWFDKNAGGHPRPVGQKQANRWGLYDICGNVWEWCNDFYKVDYYQETPPQDPRGPKAGETKVVRGGAWRFSAQSCRSGYRYNENPGYADVCFGYDIYGFRCVRKAAGATRQGVRQ